jgi:hypothetical protein
MTGQRLTCRRRLFARHRSFLLLEVLLGLALLAGLGVWLLKLQGESLRQYRYALRREEIATKVERLLWDWQVSQTPVTLPATGQFDERLHWRREVRPVRIARGVLPTQISVLVTDVQADRGPEEVYRVDWLIPRKRPSESQEPRDMERP